MYVLFQALCTTNRYTYVVVDANKTSIAFKKTALMSFTEWKMVTCRIL